MAEGAVQLWQLSGSSSSAGAAQRHQQRSNLQQYRLRQPCSIAAPTNNLAASINSLAASINSLAASINSLAAIINSHAALINSHVALINSHAALINSLAAPINSLAAVQPHQQPCSCAAPSTALHLCSPINSLASVQPINSLASVSYCEWLKSRTLSWLVKPPPGTTDVWCYQALQYRSK